MKKIPDTIIGKQNLAEPVTALAAMGMLPWGGEFEKDSDRPRIPPAFFRAVDRVAKEAGYDRVAVNLCPRGQGCPRRIFFATANDTKWGFADKAPEDSLSIYMSLSFTTDPKTKKPVMVLFHSDCRLPEYGTGDRFDEYIFDKDDLMEKALPQIVFSFIYLKATNGGRDW